MKKPFLLFAILTILSFAVEAQTQVKTRAWLWGRYVDTFKELGYAIYDHMRFDVIGKDSLSAKESRIESHEITVPEKLTIYGRDYVVAALAESAFQENTKICSVKLPPSITEIASCAFRCCYDLNDCEMPNVRKIGASAFFRTGFTRLVLPEGLEEIGYMGFTDSSRLRYVELPSTLKSISDMAFMCNNLDTVKVNFSVPIEISYGVFWRAVGGNSSRREMVLSVPKGSKEAFSVADGWKHFFEIIEH